MYLLGYDVGSSSIKATLLDAQTGNVAASAISPDRELAIQAPKPGWAEQDPDVWWEHVCKATRNILSEKPFDPGDVKAVGISYQMHGLVAVDKNQHVLRPSIIWCDSRAVETGAKAFASIGPETCMEHLLNSPGNFTASKLKWVMDNEPAVYRKIDRVMLPGEYIAMKMTGDVVTTPSGLSEGIFWDFIEGGQADILLDHYDISPALLGSLKPTFSIQGELTSHGAEELGLKAGIPVSYRAGDQPNNALSLNVLDPGEIAATAGTSGVVYGVTDCPVYDGASRVNPFVHVSHTPESPRYGVLMCINGTGILNSWVRSNCAGGLDYPAMNDLAAEVSPGAEGLSIIPFGNGAERTLENRDIAAQMYGLRFTTHDQRHFIRAAQEGIVFAFEYGLGIMRDMGVKVETVRAGHANMFLSPVFREAFASVSDTVIELYDTDGSQGAARGAGIGAGVYESAEDAFVGLTALETIEPNAEKKDQYEDAYQLWRNRLLSALDNN